MITGPIITRTPRATGCKLRPEDLGDLDALIEVARRYPDSYDRERVMRKADEILDRALDGRPIPDCVVCDDRPGGCEFCPKA